jgi:hypothetical protein
MRGPFALLAARSLARAPNSGQPLLYVIRHWHRCTIQHKLLAVVFPAVSATNVDRPQLAASWMRTCDIAIGVLSAEILVGNFLITKLFHFATPLILSL